MLQLIEISFTTTEAHTCQAAFQKTNKSKHCFVYLSLFKDHINELLEQITFIQNITYLFFLLKLH